MEVIIQPNPNAAALLISRIIADEVRRNPSLVLGLATGRTMETLYKYLVREHRDHGLDFSLCRSFNLDEYVGLAPENPNSYFAYMNRHLFKRINIDLRNTHVPNGVAPDLDAECERYEALIRRHGGIDLQLLGIGRAGHIGFNEPLSALRSRTRVKSLTPETIAQNAPLFDPPESIPRRAITMGVGTVLESKRCLMLVTGGKGGRAGQGGRRADHLDDHRLGAAAPSALHGHLRRAGSRKTRGQGILLLDFQQRARVGEISPAALKHAG